MLLKIFFGQNEKLSGFFYSILGYNADSKVEWFFFRELDNK